MTYNYGSGPPAGQPYGGQPTHPYGASPGMPHFQPVAQQQQYQAHQHPHPPPHPHPHRHQPTATYGLQPAHAQYPQYAQPAHPQHRPQQPLPQQHHYQRLPPAQHLVDPSPLTPLPPSVGYPSNTNAPLSSYQGFDATFEQRLAANQYAQQQPHLYAQHLPTSGPAQVPVHTPVIKAPSRTQPLPQPPQPQPYQQRQPQQQPHPSPQQRQQNQHNPITQFAPPQQHQTPNAPRSTKPASGITINIPHVKGPPPSQVVNSVERVKAESFSDSTPRAISKSPAMSHRSPAVSRSPALKHSQVAGVTKSGAAGGLRSPALSRSPALANVQAVAKSPATPNARVALECILIHVADECLTKAQEAAPLLATQASRETLEEYHRLVATGLACLERAIQSGKLSARVEAKARMRYAGIVLEETTDLTQAETMLSQGIALAEKRLFPDLKYCMQDLLVKTRHRRNPKAATVSLQRHIQDCDTYKHVYWSYAFRFAKISLLMNSAASTDPTALHEAIRDVGSLASRRGDRAIYVFLSLLEGLVHLKTDKTDAILKVQGCIAQASKYQLESSVHLLQIDLLRSILDLACSLRQKNPEAVRNKVQALEDCLLEAQNAKWESSELLLPMNRDAVSKPTLSKDTSSIVRLGEDAHDFLVVNFMSKNEVYAICYGFVGMAMMYKRSHSNDNNPGTDGDNKIVDAWYEALKSMPRSRATENNSSLQQAMRRSQWHSEVKIYLYILLALSRANYGEWPQVQKYVNDMENLMDESLDANIKDLFIYMKAVCLQGRCVLDEALAIYSQDRFAVQHPSGPDAESTTPRVICLLAALNTLCILQDPRHRDESKANKIHHQVRDICSTHPDPEIKMAYHLVMASWSTAPGQSMIQLKGHLQGALSSSQASNNIQGLSAALSLMRYRLFEGVVGDQALKSAKAASAQASKVGNVLWRSVAEGMLASSHEMQGQREEAMRRMADAIKFANEARAKSDAAAEVAERMR